MHWRSVQADQPHRVPVYRDVVAEVRDELLAGVDAAVAAGVEHANLIIDPGLGFAKTAEHNWALLHALPELVATGCPFWSAPPASASWAPCSPTPTARSARRTGGRPPPRSSPRCPRCTAPGVRVHDVRASVDALKVVRAWDRGGDGDG